MRAKRDMKHVSIAGFVTGIVAFKIFFRGCYVDEISLKDIKFRILHYNLAYLKIRKFQEFNEKREKFLLAILSFPQSDMLDRMNWWGGG